MTCFDAARARAVNSVRKFGAEEKGSLIIFSLFLLLTMLIVAGLAVDFMRTETLRTRMQSTLDRSVLAAASMNQALNSKEVVVDYFERAGLDQYLDKGGITVVENDFSKTVSRSEERRVGKD